jgi:hypothetical protein
MSDQETVGIGTEASPARDDLGQQTDEAIMERMFVSEEPAPVEETAEAPAEEEYEEEVEEVEASDQTLDEDDHDDDDVEEAIDEGYDDDSDEEPQVFTVKVDGKELEVDLDELKRGYSGQSYINQSMQKVADARKETESLYATLAQERGQVQQALQLLQDGTLTTPPVAPDEALFQADPLGYMEAKLAYDKQAGEYQERLGYLHQQVQANSEVQQHAKQAYLAKEAELLQGFAPELFDAEKGSDVRKQLVSSATEAYGFTAAELGSLMDHRHIRVLMDAVRYQELNSESGKKRVEQKMKNKPVRSSKRRVNAEQAKRRKAKQKLKSSGSIEDAMSLILE